MKAGLPGARSSRPGPAGHAALHPRLLICATEHYGSVVSRAFDFRRYLDEAARGQTLTRLFLLFRELHTARNPHSSLKVEGAREGVILMWLAVIHMTLNDEPM
jgi:hypothetical protein